jgi:hypothetical protein
MLAIGRDAAYSGRMGQPDPHHSRFAPLIAFLARLPAIETDASPARGFGTGVEDGLWWIKFGIALDHPLAWNVVQELGHVLNYLSPAERLPTQFKPVSPPPHLNGGPRDYLSWVIECAIADMDPATVAEWLESRLPDPDDESEWASDG